MAKRKLKKGWKVVAKFALAPSRSAFLLAVSVNIFKLAKRLNQLYVTNPDKLKNFWEKFGGDFEKLKKAITKGLTHKKALGFAVTTATISASLPIITAVIKLFKELKTDKQGDDVEDDKGVKDINNEIQNDPSGSKTGVKTVVVDEKGNEVKNYMPILIGGAVLVGGYFLIKRR